MRASNLEIRMLRESADVEKVLTSSRKNISKFFEPEESVFIL
jgi:hypothetical protein